MGLFYAGEQYNFLVFGDYNPEEDDDKEVLRAVFYDKGWNRVGHVSVYSRDGVDIYQGIRSSEPCCAEKDGVLYIHASRLMYETPDGLHHQSNWTVAIDEARMKVVQSNTPGYASHSFNQFILAPQEGGLVTLDHGDGYPRGIQLRKYTIGEDKSATATETELLVEKFPGDAGETYTGAALGSFVETSTGYMFSYEYDGNGIPSNDNRSRDAYYCYVDKATFTGTPVRLTTTKNASIPYLDPMGLDGGYIMWNGFDKELLEPNDTLYYARYTADGKIGEVKQAKARLSDCRPVLHDGKVVWYTTYKGPRTTIPPSLSIPSMPAAACPAGRSGSTRLTRIRTPTTM